MSIRWMIQSTVKISLSQSLPHIYSTNHILPSFLFFTIQSNTIVVCKGLMVVGKNVTTGVIVFLVIVSKNILIKFFGILTNDSFNKILGIIFEINRFINET